jgi:hypothetical protein
MRLVLATYVRAPFRPPNLHGRRVATTMGVLFLAVTAIGIAAVCSWRMFVGAVAARPVSDRLRLAAGQPDFKAADFAVLERIFAAAGALAGTSRGAILVRRYYQAVEAIGGLFPTLAPWSQREMAVCSRYLAARIDRFLLSNAACGRRVRTL